MALTIEELKELIQTDEHRQLELKKTTGEFKDGMQSACAFLNTEGGWLIFGIAPTSLKIVGQMVTDNTQRELARALSGMEPAIDVRAQYIEVPDSDGKQVIALHFDSWEEGQIPYTYQGRPYIRVESTTRLMPREIYDERLRSSNPNKFAWEAQVADGITIADLSEERIRNAVRGGITGGRINASAENDDPESLLDKFKLLKDGKITNAAVVLFGKNLYDYPQLMLRMAYFRGKDKLVFIDNKQAEGNFYDLLDAGIAFCFRHLSLSGEVKGLLREEHLEIPIEALREALTNALCHRRYDDPRATVSLAIFDDRLEITNPGCLPVPLTPKTIKEPHGSYPYNLRIAQVLYLSTNLERWGTGVSRMVELCREQGVPKPEYMTDDHEVKIVFKKKYQYNSDENKNVNNDSYGGSGGNPGGSMAAVQLSDIQIKICELIKNDSRITVSQMAVVLAVAKRTLERNLADLQKKGILSRTGNTSAGRWILLKESK